MAINRLLFTQLVNENIRTPEGDWTVDGNGEPVASFTPALTAAQLVVYADLTAMCKSTFLAGMTYPEYLTIKPFLATLRTFQQQSQSEFIALTQNARDRALFDTVTALIRVQRQMMRDA